RAQSMPGAPSNLLGSTSSDWWSERARFDAGCLEVMRPILRLPCFSVSIEERGVWQVFWPERAAPLPLRTDNSVALLIYRMPIRVLALEWPEFGPKRQLRA